MNGSQSPAAMVEDSNGGLKHVSRRGGAVRDVVTSETNTLTGGISIIAKVTQAEYDAIAVPDDSTLYVIVG